MSFRNTQAHGNADVLSRLPMSVETAEPKDLPELVLLLEHLDDSPVTATQIEHWTRRHSSLALLVQALQQGWPEESLPELEPFQSKRSELSLFRGCVLWGSRVIVPERGRRAILEQLYVGHLGMSK